MKTTVAAMDFGTSKLITLVAEVNGKTRCDIIGAGIATYDGFLNGQWNAPNSLNEAILTSVREAEGQSGTRIKDINIGVPGDFCHVRTVESKVDLQGADPHVTENDINSLFDAATEKLGDPEGTIIHRSAAWFMVDDGKKTLEPMGMRGYELRAVVSFVIADRYFIADVSERLKALGFNASGCFSSPTGQALLFVPEEERDRTAVLVDIGYLNTEVMTIEGETLTYLKVIPMGGGNIAADVAYGLDISLPAAEKIKRDYVYGLSVGQPIFEAVGQSGNTETFQREDVEKVLEPRVEEICDEIKTAIEESGVKLGNWSNVYLTGGGLAINRGGRDFLAAKLDRPVRELPHKAVKLSSPAYSSALGLLDLIIDTKSQKQAPAKGISGFFHGLFGY